MIPGVFVYGGIFLVLPRVLGGKWVLMPSLQDAVL